MVNIGILATSLIFWGPAIAVPAVIAKNLLDRIWFKIGWMS
jgi:hypothetical protein